MDYFSLLQVSFLKVLLMLLLRTHSLAQTFCHREETVSSKKLKNFYLSILYDNYLLKFSPQYFSGTNFYQRCLSSKLDLLRFLY